MHFNNKNYFTAFWICNLTARRSRGRFSNILCNILINIVISLLQCGFLQYIKGILSSEIYKHKLYYNIIQQISYYNIMFIKNEETKN